MNSALQGKTKAKVVAELLAARIDSGFYQQGEILPPSRTLATELGVSVPTLQRACKILGDQGALNLRPRHPPFVPLPKPRQSDETEVEPHQPMRCQPDLDLAKLSIFSKIFTGNSSLLPTAVWIWTQKSRGSFYQQEIARALNTNPQYIRRELLVLNQLGMIEPIGNTSDVPSFWTICPDHPGWLIVDGAHAAAIQLGR